MSDQYVYAFAEAAEVPVSCSAARAPASPT